MDNIALPTDITPPDMPLADAIERRESVREYGADPISLRELSCLLRYAVGFASSSGARRAAPSAGALYPIEAYPIVNAVEYLSRGIYHYSAEAHSLDVVREGDFRSQLVRSARGQRMLGEANFVLALTAVPERASWKYRERALRYIALEAGHMAQNVYLLAASMGLGACAVGAFSDEEYARLIGLDGVRESVIYLITVGRPRSG